MEFARPNEAYSLSLVECLQETKILVVHFTRYGLNVIDKLNDELDIL